MNNAGSEAFHSTIVLEDLAQGIETMPRRKAQSAQEHVDKSAPTSHTALWQGISQRWSEPAEQENATTIAQNIRLIAKERGAKLSVAELCDELKEATGGMERKDAFLVGEVLAAQLVLPGAPNFSGTDATVMQQRASVSEKVITALAA